MATLRQLKNDVKMRYFHELMDYFKESDRDVYQTKSNEFVIPEETAEKDEIYIKIVVSIPTGARDDAEGYNGEEIALDYARKCKEKEEKKKKDAEKKAKKIARDTERRRKAKEEKE